MRIRANLVNSSRLRWTLEINCAQRGSDLPFRDTLVLLFQSRFFFVRQKINFSFLLVDFRAGF
ncbi:MAG: hypothetical protein DME77_01705 [Verrucomicrobia bacterium]|nr:MAG: hypothetical protein DME77_01705 [Verrucomicrobiota bacterium]